MKLFIKCFILVSLLLTSCTIYETTKVHFISPPKDKIAVYPFVETLDDSSATILWQINDYKNSFIEFKKENGKPEIIAGILTNEMFKAAVSNLEAGAVYYYRLAGDANKFSKFRTFSKNRKNFSFAVLGDNRTNPDKFEKIAAAAAKFDVDFFIHTGDMMTDGRKKNQWYKQWFKPARPMLEKAPVFVAWGNHEYPWLQNSYLNYFYPDRSKFNGQSYYSFQNGNILFIQLNIFDEYKQGSKQYIWLENILKNNKAPFTIVALHIAPFTSGAHAKDKGVADVRQFLVPLLQKYNVNLVVSGHDHLYERSDYKGTTYIIAGGAGAPLYQPDTKKNPYSIKALKTLHYIIFSTDGEKITAKVYNLQGKIIDEFSINPKSKI